MNLGSRITRIAFDLKLERNQVINWLSQWINRRIKQAVESELHKIRIIHEDPLRVFNEQRHDIQRQLREAVNLVGNEVAVGSNVILWGGKFRDGLGIELHDHVRIYDQCSLVLDHLTPASGIVLEEGVAINFRSYLDGSGGVRICKRSILGPNVVILSSDHRTAPEVAITASGKELAAVHIGEDVWIGASAVVLKGVRIGDRSVIGAGAIVTRDIPSDSIAVGNPARVIRKKNQQFHDRMFSGNPKDS
jgi:acetyltransferase-like isoleucine patch superfamily enzyme